MLFFSIIRLPPPAARDFTNGSHFTPLAAPALPAPPILSLSLLMYFLDKVVTQCHCTKQLHRATELRLHFVSLLKTKQQDDVRQPSCDTSGEATCKLVRNSAKKSGEISAKTQDFFTLIILIMCVAASL